MPAPRVAQRKPSLGSADRKNSPTGRPTNETPATSTSTATAAAAPATGTAGAANAAASKSALLKKYADRGQDAAAQRTGRPRSAPRQQPQKLKNHPQQQQQQQQQQQHKKQKHHQHGHQHQQHQQQEQRRQHLRGGAAIDPAGRTLASTKSNTRGTGNDRGVGANLPPASASAPPPPPPTERAKKPAAVKRTGDGQQSSRRNASQPTPRQEYTLFDHLLASNPNPRGSNTDTHNRASARAPRRHGDKMGVASRPRLGQRDALGLAGTEGGDGVVLARRNPGSTSDVPSWPGGSAKGVAKGAAAAAAAAAAAVITTTATGKADTRYALGDFVLGSSSRGVAGEREKKKAHAKKPVAVAAAANAFAPKPGKQRLGPRLKKLSTLKKRILLDREARWREQGNPAATETLPLPPPPRPPPGDPPAGDGAVKCLDDDGCACVPHGGGIGDDEPAAVHDKWYVIIHHLVDEEDVEESDEHAEVVRDLWEMAGAFGVVQGVEVPRAAPTTGRAIAAKVAFSTHEEAERARQGFHGRVVGGKTLEIEIAEEAAAGERRPRSGAQGKKACDGIGTPTPPEETSLEQGERRQEAAVIQGQVSAVVKEEMCGPLAQLQEGSGHNAVVKKELREPTTLLRNASDGISKGDMGEDSAPPPLWRVVVENFVDEEDDLDDEDEYAEICADAAKMMGAYGCLAALDIPRGGREEASMVRGKIVATFSSLEEAEACVAGTRGRRVGGKDLDAKLLGPPQGLTVRPGRKLRENGEVRPPASTPPEEGRRELGGSKKTNTGVEKPSAIDSDGAGLAVVAAATLPADRLSGGGRDVEGGSSAAGGVEAAVAATVTACCWRVVVRNLVEEDDLEDDDDYDEVRADVAAMASAYGELAALHVPRQAGAAAGVAGAELGEAVVSFGSVEQARACARGLHGRAVGGKCLEAQVLAPPSQREQDLEAGDRPGDGIRRPAKVELPPSCVVRVQSGARSLVPAGREVHGQVPACRGRDGGGGGGGGGGRDAQGRDGRGEGTSAPTGGAMTAVSHSKPTAAAQSSLFATSTSAGEKWRIPDKYKEAVALPKAPGANDRAPRVYVDQPPDVEVDTLVVEMLRILFKFQERARLSDPAKHMARRRLVMGLKEVMRALKAKKVRLIILAPDVDRMEGDGGLDDKASEIVSTARDGGLPVVFALNRRKIGKTLGKSVKVSVVAVCSFDGANEEYKKLNRRMEAIGALP